MRDLLGRILSSETFKRSERARSLLAYLVEREQAGEADRLKGYAIAVDVFGRDEEFDSSTDAVVRVQAGRLRELLGHYYETEGCAIRFASSSRAEAICQAMKPLRRARTEGRRPA